MKRLLLSLAILLICACSVYAAEFLPAFEQVILPHEGGFQNIHSDNGNWTGCRVGKGVQKGTMAGISACTFPNEDIRHLQRPRIAELYDINFWKQFHLGECRLQTTADRILDGLVNNGPLAAKWMKRAINRVAHKHLVDETTIRVTSYTIEQLNAQRQDRVLFWFAIYRGMRYDSLAGQYEEFIDNWADREVDEIITAVHDRDRLMGFDLKAFEKDVKGSLK